MNANANETLDPNLLAVASLAFKGMAADRVAMLAVPGTDYVLHLAVDRPLDIPPGRRVRGTLHAEALRMHSSGSGGKFIEPIWGMPRIVQGSVLATDEANGRLLMDMVVPIWITPLKSDHPGAWKPGAMLNFYVKSGARFEPLAPGSPAAAAPLHDAHPAAPTAPESDQHV